MIQNSKYVLDWSFVRFGGPLVPIPMSQTLGFLIFGFFEQVNDNQPPGEKKFAFVGYVNLSPGHAYHQQVRMSTDISETKTKNGLFKSSE